MRVFMFSYRECMGEVGGSAGVNYKLYMANKKFSFIHNMIHLFKGTALTQDDTETDKFEFNVVEKQAGKIRRMLKHIGLLDIFNYERKLIQAGKWIERLDKIYSFLNDDVFVFHDFESAYAFSRQYAYDRMLFVYHQQGSLYAEWKAYHNIISPIYHLYLDKKQKDILKKIPYIGFPSNGAKEMLIHFDNYMKEFKMRDDAFILYNGFSKPNTLKISKKVQKIIEERKDVWTFITVAKLNYAKGVEQIPQFLGKLKKHSIEFEWIVIGDGKQSTELLKEIDKWNLKNNMIWIKDFVRHEDILALFEISDFYILFHRWSIFDFATIEAMCYGVVPILSSVGGNLEMVENGKSGVILEDIDDVNEILSLFNSNQYELYKGNCMKRQKERFSEETFLKQYKTCVEEICKGNR